MAATHQMAQRYSLVMALSVALITLLPLNRVAASPSMMFPTASLGSVQAVGITDGQPPVYVATDSGLYRSAAPTYALWTQQNTFAYLAALSPNPRNPDDLVYTREYDLQASKGTYHSMDGGRTAQRVVACPFISLSRAAAPSQVLYGGISIGDNCVALQPRPPGYWSLLPADELTRSTDDGLTWTAVLTSQNGYIVDGTIAPIAIAAHDSEFVVAGDSVGRAIGSIVGSNDGGRTWSVRQNERVGYRIPRGLAVDPTDPRTMWAVWEDLGLYRSHDGGRTWQQVQLVGFPMTQTTAGTDISITALILTSGGFYGLATDPLTGRVYVSEILANATVSGFERRQQTAIYAFDPHRHYVDRFASADADLGDNLAITRNGYLLSWCDKFCDFGDGPYALSVKSLNSGGAWGLSSVFRAAAPSPVLHVLGQPLSPTEKCAGVPCQYFDKGALALGAHGAVSVVPLVPALLNTRSSLPVGGSTSTVTYRILYALHSRRTPMPSGFNGGTRTVPGGTFVPYSPTLAPASGYVVPSVFWRYLSDPRSAPGGWQAAIGLPLTPAVPATVSKGKLGTRTILIQAFQRAILTYDPRNAVPFRVERANIGADDAALFPAAVR